MSHAPDCPHFEWRYPWECTCTQYDVTEHFECADCPVAEPHMCEKVGYCEHRDANLGWTERGRRWLAAGAPLNLHDAAIDLYLACDAALRTHGLAESEPGLPSLKEVKEMLRAAIARADGPHPRTPSNG